LRNQETEPKEATPNGQEIARSVSNDLLSGVDRMYESTEWDELSDGQKIQLLLDENLRMAKNLAAVRMFRKGYKLEKDELRDYAGDIVDPDGSHCIIASVIVYFKKLKEAR
jgi:hypothetical protein